MFLLLYSMIPFLLFPPVTPFALSSNESLSSLISQNIPYFRRSTDGNGTALNNITSNITSGSEKVIWIIQDIYNASNFFQ